LTKLSDSKGGNLRAAIVGAGFIADYHARGIANAEGVDLIAVCDANGVAATAFGVTWNIPSYTALETMLAEQKPDVLHVLVPPGLHHSLAMIALRAGVGLFLEKPMCVSSVETAEVLALASKSGLEVGVNHSMTFDGSYCQLRDLVKGGEIGPVDHITINYFLELGLIRFGPFDNWMLREPGNLLLELGPHPVSWVVDLIGVPDRIEVKAEREIVLPGGSRVYRRWRINARAGRASADLTIEMGPGFPQRTISVRGAVGAVFADLNADTCLLDKQTPKAMDFDRHKRILMQAKELRKQAGTTLANFVLSKAKLRKKGNPNQIAMQSGIETFYADLRGKRDLDFRLSGTFGHSVIQLCEQIIDTAKLKGGEKPNLVAPAKGLKPTVLVLGGTGFIGRRLVKQLLDKGYAVRAAARSFSPALQEFGSDQLEIVRADMRSPDDMANMLEGIEYVFNLATTDAKNWGQFVEREIEPTRLLAKLCLEKKIKRLIYTGTIDSYYAGGKAGTITETTPLDRNILRRNNYARAKAACEDLLTKMHKEEGLPLVIARPGIVIGQGGNPFHWGVGKWASEGVVETWGDGRNKLPLVLVDDVASGLVRCMEVDGIDGRSYNLIDAPLLSARDYIAALEEMGGFKIAIHERPIWQHFADDFAKWPIKRAVGHPDGQRIPSYADWESRSQRAIFDSSRTREELGWKPISDADQMRDLGIAGSMAGWLAARG
jgi:nucleoside-diphosphate-sugar epimerase/predicted dehydrogenase